MWKIFCSANDGYNNQIFWYHSIPLTTLRKCWGFNRNWKGIKNLFIYTISSYTHEIRFPFTAAPSKILLKYTFVRWWSRKTWISSTPMAEVVQLYFDNMRKAFDYYYYYLIVIWQCFNTGRNFLVVHHALQWKMKSYSTKLLLYFRQSTTLPKEQYF